MRFWERYWKDIFGFLFFVSLPRWCYSFELKRSFKKTFWKELGLNFFLLFFLSFFFSSVMWYFCTFWYFNRLNSITWIILKILFSIYFLLVDVIIITPQLKIINWMVRIWLIIINLFSLSFLVYIYILLKSRDRRHIRFLQRIRFIFVLCLCVWLQIIRLFLNYIDFILWEILINNWLLLIYSKIINNPPTILSLFLYIHLNFHLLPLK